MSQPRSLQCAFPFLAVVRTLLMLRSVTGSCTGVTFILFILYNNWILEKVKESHIREVRPEELQHETHVEKMKRKYRESALQPGSVV